MTDNLQALHAAQAAAPKTRWHVQGVRPGGEPVSVIVEARSAESAQRAVQQTGATVTSVAPESLSYVSPTAQAADNDGVHIESVRPGAAFTFGFFAFLGGLAAYAVVAAVVGFVALLIMWSIR